MDRLIRDAGGGDLNLLNYSASGDLADVDTTQAPAVAVTDSAGIAVAGFTPSRTVAGTYKATLPANFEVLDIYDVVWSWPNGQTRRSQFELVGRHLYTQADLRAFDAPLANETKYPDAALRIVRDEVTDRFEIEAGVSFIPRGAREVVSGDGTKILLLRERLATRVVSIAVAGTALSAAELAKVKLHRRGTLEYDGGVFTSGILNVSILYEHGYATAPGPVVRAAWRYARYIHLNPVLDQNERATAVFTEAYGYRLTLPGRDGPTGLPEVDAVLVRYGKLGPAFA